MRPAAKSRPREDLDDAKPGGEADAPEASVADAEPPAEAAEYMHPGSELPPLQTTSKSKGAGGFLQLIIIAIIGIVIGFAAVMLV